MVDNQQLEKVPGPKGLPVIGSTLDFIKNPILFLLRMRRQYGDLLHFKLNFRNYYFLANPNDIKNFFVRDYANFDKSTTFVRLRRAIGSGLLTCPLADHKRQRRSAQPAFTASSLEAFGEKLPGVILEHIRNWSPDATFDATSQMDTLVLKIAARVLFGDEVTASGKTLEHEIEKFHRKFTPLRMTLSSIFPGLLGFGSTKRYFQQITERTIEKGLTVGFAEKNLISAMLEPVLAEGQPSKRVVNELTSQIINMILASVETVATTLNWMWYLLSINQDAQRKMQDEIDLVFQGQIPTVDKLPNLIYTESVIKETMRLFPAGWVISRVALNDYRVGESVIPKGSIVTVSPFITQRDERFFQDPLSFKPARWSSETQDWPEFSYFPFGGGPRSCIGAGFSMMEMKLVAATILQKWSMDLVPGQKVDLHPLVTLRPKEHIFMKLSKRRREAGRFGNILEGGVLK